MIMINTEGALNKVLYWEQEMGESFQDYFSHDNFDEDKWIKFLENKGHKDYAEYLRQEKYSSHMGILCQDEIFHIYPLYSDDGEDFYEENYNKNITLQLEFIISNENLVSRFIEFLKEDNDR